MNYFSIPRRLFKIIHTTPSFSFSQVVDAQSGHVLDGFGGSAPVDVVELLMFWAAVGEVPPRRPGRRSHYEEPVESRGRHCDQPEEEGHLPVRGDIVYVQRETKKEEKPYKNVMVVCGIVEKSRIFRVRI